MAGSRIRPDRVGLESLVGSLKQRLHNMAIALAFGFLGTVVGGAVGGPILRIAALFVAALGAYVLAEKHGWLVRAPEGATAARRARDWVVTVGAAGFVALYVFWTGGKDSPLSFALYLPVVLAVLCYGLRVGLFATLGMTAVYAAFDCHQGGSLHSLLHEDAGPLLSIPLVGLFATLLHRRLEERYRALDRQKRDLSALLDMSQMMDAAFDLDMTLNLILLNVEKLSGCQVCAVYLKDASGENLELRASSGARGRVLLLPFLPLAEARCGDWTMSDMSQRGESVLAFYAPDSQRPVDPACPALFRLDRRARSFACVPLTSVEGLLGLLYIGYNAPSRLKGDDVARLERLATRAAFPLQRVLLQQDFQSLAYSDAMTGLDNFRRFEQDLGDELLRAERYGRPLSVILLDIDHFKQFNDTLGHQAGDALLGQLAVVLRNSLRNVDKPARYGGEEFVIICPETGRDEARMIAERIRRNVADTAFALLDRASSEEGGEHRPGLTHVTVSLGYATYPYDSCTARDLVKQADDALYAAKDSGRNAVRGPGDAEIRLKIA